MQLARLRLARLVTCPDCRGEGYVAVPATTWDQWFGVYETAKANHERVLIRYLAGEASLAELDTAVGALTDAGGEPQPISTPAELHGEMCEACDGYGKQPRQRRIVSRHPARFTAGRQVTA